VVRASLEAAFMELTADSVEYRAEGQPGPGDPPGPGQPAAQHELAAQELATQGQHSSEGRN